MIEFDIFLRKTVNILKFEKSRKHVVGERKDIVRVLLQASELLLVYGNFVFLDVDEDPQVTNNNNHEDQQSDDEETHDLRVINKGVDSILYSLLVFWIPDFFLAYLGFDIDHLFLEVIITFFF